MKHTAVRHVIAAMLCLLVAGCEKNPVILWSSEARSPDNNFLAKVEDLNWAGPGNNYDMTSVTLQQIFASGALGEPGAILSFTQKGNYDVYVTLHWRDKNHLDVGYKGGHLTFQAVKAFDIEIETHYINN